MSHERISFRQKATIGATFGLIGFITAGTVVTVERSNGGGAPTQTEREADLVTLANAHNIQVTQMARAKNATEITFVRQGERNDDCIQRIRLFPPGVIEFLPAGPGGETFTPDQAIEELDHQFQDCN